MKKRSTISSIAIALILGASAVQGASDTHKFDNYRSVGDMPVHHYYGFSDTSVKQSVDKALDTHRKLMKAAPKQVLSGFDETLEAIRALEKNDIKAAKKLLVSASESFKKALEANPGLKRVPIADDITVTEIASTPSQIEKAIDLAKEALDAHRISEARGLLMPLRDEMVIATQYLPMDLYPTATRLAANMLENGHKKEALQTLNTALGTLGVDEVVIPMPLVRAQAYVAEASKLDKSKKKEAMRLLDAASSELQKALLLGYTDKHSGAYKDLSKQIEAIRDEIGGKNEVEKLYEHLKASFEALFHKTEKDGLKDAVSKEEARALKNPAGVKDAAAARAEVEEAQDKRMFEAKEKMRAFDSESTHDEKSVLKH